MLCHGGWNKRIETPDRGARLRAKDQTHQARRDPPRPSRFWAKETPLRTDCSVGALDGARSRRLKAVHVPDLETARQPAEDQRLFAMCGPDACSGADAPTD